MDDAEKAKAYDAMMEKKRETRRKYRESLTEDERLRRSRAAQARYRARIHADPERLERHRSRMRIASTKYRSKKSEPEA